MPIPVPIFSKTFTVLDKQVEGGRLSHIALIELLQACRHEFLAEHNMQEDHIVPGIGFVIGELAVNFRGAARARDLLNITLSVGNISEKKCTLLYKVETNKAKFIASAQTIVVFVDMNKETATKIPEKFLALIRSPESNDYQSSHPPKISRL